MNSPFPALPVTQAYDSDVSSDLCLALLLLHLEVVHPNRLIGDFFVI